MRKSKALLVFLVIVAFFTLGFAIGCQKRVEEISSFDNFGLQEFTLSVDEFIDFLTVWAEENGGKITNIPLPEDGKEKGDNGEVMHSYVMSSTNLHSDSTHIQITSNKSSGKIKHINTFSEMKEIQKEDGTIEKSPNIDYSICVNIVMLSLNTEIDIEDFDERLKLISTGTKFIEDTFGDIRCISFENGNFKSVSFERIAEN